MSKEEKQQRSLRGIDLFKKIFNLDESKKEKAYWYFRKAYAIAEKREGGVLASGDKRNLSEWVKHLKYFRTEDDVISAATRIKEEDWEMLYSWFAGGKSNIREIQKRALSIVKPSVLAVQPSAPDVTPAIDLSQDAPAKLAIWKYVNDNFNSCLNLYAGQIGLSKEAHHILRIYINYFVQHTVCRLLKMGWQNKNESSVDRFLDFFQDIGREGVIRTSVAQEELHGIIWEFLEYLRDHPCEKELINAVLAETRSGPNLLKEALAFVEENSPIGADGRVSGECKVEVQVQEPAYKIRRTEGSSQFATPSVFFSPDQQKKPGDVELPASYISPQASK